MCEPELSADVATDLLFGEPNVGRCLIGPDGRVLRANAEWLRGAGLTGTDVLGRDILELAPDIRDAYHRARAGEAVAMPRQRRSGDDETWWAGSLVPVPMTGGTGVLATSRDVIGAAALRDSASTFRHLVENSPFGIYAVDADFRLVQVSAGAQKVFENVRPLLGRDFAEVLRIIWNEPFATEAIGRFRHTLQTGEPYHAPSTVEQRHDIGRVESYDWKVERVVLPDGRFGVVCHFYDLSERQKYEAALREGDRRKSEFLAVLSHELRNPLAPIRTGIHLLERAEPGSPPATRALQVMRRQTDHLTRLVDDLLDITRISRGKIELRLEPLDVRDVVRTTTDDLRALFEESRLELRLELPPGPLWVKADRTRLSQILGNLLQNSLKFTPAGGIVTVRLTARADAVEFGVHDTGVGLDAGRVEQIFEPFTQGDAGLAIVRGGLGLGLSLVRGLVELHSGTVEARSEGVGCGADFVVRLPRAPSPEAAATVRAAAVAPASRVIVVIEDNADAAQMLADLLALHGHEVRVARDGASGVALARQLVPHVVLCDIGLPDMEGYDVARALREDERTKGVRLIALSGYAQPEDRRRAQDAGFDAHITKPPQPDRLVAVLQLR